MIGIVCSDDVMALRKLFRNGTPDAPATPGHDCDGFVHRNYCGSGAEFLVSVGGSGYKRGSPLNLILSWSYASQRKSPAAPPETDASARLEARESLPVEEGERIEQIFAPGLYP